MKIYKYELAITDTQEVQIPNGAKILTAQFQSGKLVMWAMVNPEASTTYVTINIYGTGHEMEDTNQVYLSTVQSNGLVWHIFISY